MGTSLFHLAAPRGRRSTGFTILELLILMVVLGVAARRDPVVLRRPDVTLESAAELLANDLRELGGRAAVYREKLSLRFDEDGDGYSATDWSGQLLVSLRRRPLRPPLRLRRGLPRSDHRGAEPAPRSVTFDATGTASHSISVTVGYAERPAWSRSPRTGLVTIDEGPAADRPGARPGSAASGVPGREAAANRVDVREPWPRK